jgi:hypothetical protein
VWLLPLRKPVVDANDHLRLAYWSGNDALQGAVLAVPSTVTLAPSDASNMGDGDGSHASIHRVHGTNATESVRQSRSVNNQRW